MVYNFVNSKKNFLAKKDKSNKGGIDEQIALLCEAINARDDCFSTSSCSGRMVLVRDALKKGKGLFLFRTHDILEFDSFKKILQEVAGQEQETVMFKQEPCLLVVSCKDAQTQEWLFNQARNNGWKKSGMLSLNKKFLVELMSTGGMEFPIINKGKVLVSDEFLEVVIKKSNQK